MNQVLQIPSRMETPQTAQSIAKAKTETEQARAALRSVGIVIDAEGRLIKLPKGQA